MEQQQYLLGQGKVYVGQRDPVTGKPGALRWLRDVSAAKVALKVTELNHKESYSGQRATTLSITTGKEATIDLTLMELTKENLAMATQGTAVNVASGSVTGEVLPAALLVNDRVALKYPKVAAVVITDSSATPAVVDVSKYVVDAEYGAITVLDVTGIVQPLKVAYTYSALESISIFSAAQKDVFLRYEGINLADEGKPIIVELYRVSSKPLKDLNLITDKLADMNISADILIDTNKPASTELGQFGRIIRPT